MQGSLRTQELKLFVRFSVRNQIIYKYLKFVEHKKMREKEIVTVGNNVIAFVYFDVVSYF